MPKRKPIAAAGFADTLLSGETPRVAPTSELPAPSKELKRVLKPLERFLARVDGDAIDREDKVPPRVLAGLKRLGVFRLRVPRAHGGLGLSHSDYHRIVSLVAARSAGLSMWVTTQSLAVELLARAGTATQRSELLPRLAAGELSAFAMTEAGAGADPSRLAATARAARGGYRLDGSKLWVTNGPVARWVVVLARAPGGITAFLVDARAPGFSVERRCRFLGLRGMENGVLRLRGVFVPDARRLGAEGDGLRLGLSAMNVGRLSVAARALGLARECLRISRSWTRTRRVLGRTLAADASAAERLARLETLVARLAAVSARTAAWADAGADLRWESALSKLFAASAAWEAADLALQLRGGRGYETADSQRARGDEPEPVERLLRDARGLRVIEGTDDVLRGALARRILELARRAGGALTAESYARADAAARLFGELCAHGALVKTKGVGAILVVDVGGTNVKIRATGRKTPIKLPSGPDLTARRMVSEAKRAVEGWTYDRVTIGFPGPVVDGRSAGEPVNLGRGWKGFDFRKAFGRPVKVINDAAMQALGSYRGGRMLFLGLGTGLGSALVVDGVLQPLEMGQMPYKNGKSYEDYLGRQGLADLGKKKWRREVFKVVALLKFGLQADEVVLGGGNAKKLKELPPGARLGSNANAFLGGTRLWKDPAA